MQSQAVSMPSYEQNKSKSPVRGAVRTASPVFPKRAGSARSSVVEHSCKQNESAVKRNNSGVSALSNRYPPREPNSQASRILLSSATAGRRGACRLHEPLCLNWLGPGNAFSSVLQPATAQQNHFSPLHQVVHGDGRQVVRRRYYIKTRIQRFSIDSSTGSDTNDAPTC